MGGVDSNLNTVPTKRELLESNDTRVQTGALFDSI